MNRQFIISLISAVTLSTAQLISAANNKPRIVQLKHTSSDLVPIISYDVSLPPYSADKTGSKDCTDAFTAAFADATANGGTVFAPAGRYRIEGNLTIPRGVALRGDWKAPTKTDQTVDGTILLAYAGRGSANGKAFIGISQGGLRDVTIYYPEQKINDIQPYPVTVNLIGDAAMENVTLVNSYKGILTGSFSTVTTVYGTTFDYGLTMLKAVAVPRCRNIRLSPRYWAGSGLKDAPSHEQIEAKLKELKSFGVQLNRQDAGIFANMEIDGYHTGLKFMPPHGWTYWHNIQIHNVDVGIHFTGGSDHRGYMTRCTIDAKKYGVLMQMDKERWEDDWPRHSKSGREYGTKRDVGHLRMFECIFSGTGSNIYLDGSFNHVINMQDCTFNQWGSGSEDAAIKSVGGNITVYDCSFEQSKRHIIVESRPSHLEIVGNTFAGKPDLKLPKFKDSIIDHKNKVTKRPFPKFYRAPDRLPRRTGSDSLYIATDAPFNAPNNGKADATKAIQAALLKAGKDGGGTVFLPQGSYRLTAPIKVPAGVELRGINDFMPRGMQVRTLIIADVPGDRGKPDNQPLISLYSKNKVGSGVAGLGLWYPHQDYRDVQPYPWTIQSRGPRCWVQRVYLGNCYNAVDFATYDNDFHVLTRVCGSALNIAFMVGNSKTIGWIDNCHIRPQDWAQANPKIRIPKKTKKNPNPKPPQGYVFDIPGNKYAKPSTADIFRGTKHTLIPNMKGAGAITIASGANEQITAFFTNGATRAFDFIDQTGKGGGNANILIGGSEAGWGAWVKQLGPKGLNMINFSFNPMTRLPYTKPEDILPGHMPKGMAIRIDKSVSSTTPINLICPKLYGRKDVDLGIDMRGGNVLIKQGMISEYKRGVLEVKGGKYTRRNTEMKIID